jgi:hypothetical protein
MDKTHIPDRTDGTDTAESPQSEQHEAELSHVQEQPKEIDSVTGRLDLIAKLNAVSDAFKALKSGPLQDVFDSLDKLQKFEGRKYVDDVIPARYSINTQTTYRASDLLKKIDLPGVEKACNSLIGMLRGDLSRKESDEIKRIKNELNGPKA